MLENRWYTKTGKRKRIPNDLEYARHLFPKSLLVRGNCGIYMPLLPFLEIVIKYFSLSYEESKYLMAFLYGIYQNEHQHYIFSCENYKKGEKLYNEYVKKTYEQKSK